LKEEKPLVLYVIDTLATGGAETSLLEIASRLQNYHPVVCVLYANKTDLRQAFEGRNIKLIFLNLTSRFWWNEGATRLRSVLIKEKPAIVHATLFKSEIVTRLAIKRTNIPQVGSFVNDSYSINRYSQQSMGRNFKLNVVRLVDMLTAKRVDHFMSITDAIADSNTKALSIDRKKVTTIYRGRNVDGFLVSHPPLSTPFRFLTVARLLKRKGYLELFEACAILKDKGYKFRVDIAGDGPDLGLFISTVKKLQIEDCVSFLRTRNDVPELLAASHCFVFPSHYEGQGGALVEAMLAAKPIVASDIPVFREQITDGKTGWLFEIFNAGKLAEHMEWMMGHYDQGIQMGVQARAVAEERFNIQRTVQLHEAMYTRILSEHSKSSE
jgi:glycosyltransferase involved in cell wall biosynthesis